MANIKKTKILLVSPNTRPFEFSFEIFTPPRSGCFPLGLASLAAFIDQYGYDVRILDAYSDDLSQQEVNAAIREYAPDVVGLTSPIHHEFGIETIKACKAIAPKIVTVLGGLTPTFMPREIMEHMAELDYIISGEGEIPFLYLLRALEGEMELEDIRGLVHRKDGAIVINEGRYRVEDLDALPFLFEDRFLTKGRRSYFQGRRGIATEASRGCYYGCQFCVVNKHFGHGVRYRSPERILEELQRCIGLYQMDSFYFWDSTFTADRERTHRLLDAMIRSDLHGKFRFRCMTRLDCVDAELLRKMKEANCHSISYGVESCSQEVLDHYQKKWRSERTARVFEETRRAGIATAALLIFNQYDPGGAGAIRRRTEALTAFLKYLHPDEITLSPLVICPNSPMYEEILREGGIDPEGYRELFRRRHIPSRRISGPEMERIIMKVYLQSSWENRMKWAMHGISNLFQPATE